MASDKIKSDRPISIGLPAKAGARRRSKARGGKSSASWQVVSRRLEADILAGKFNDAGRLPPETMLAREQGATRHTLRRAIAALAAKGMVRIIPHQGAFLAPLRLSFPLDAMARFSEAIAPTGLEPGGLLLSQRRCLPPAEVAELLEIAKRTEVIELSILRTASGNPIGYVTIWLPAERFGRAGELFKATGELRRAMAQMGVADYRRSKARVTSRRADETERAHLALEEGDYVLVVESVSVDHAGEPTHVSLFRFAADRVDLTFAT